MSARDSRPGHVGICVVYLVDEAQEVLFERHLEQLRRLRAGSAFRIYAGVARLQAKYLERLRAEPWVQVCELLPTEQRGSYEHAHYLDQLAAIAAASGAAAIGTLDVDSFPIAEDWLAAPLAALGEGAALVGVLRRENADVAVPHPSFMLFGRAFWERYRPTFNPLLETRRGQAFAAAVGQPQLDTGAGYGVVLHEERLAWRALTRSNAVDEHPLMAGIYGDLIFHFGGGSRDKVFSLDVREARKLRPEATMEEIRAEAGPRNAAAAERLLAEMAADFDGLVRRLMGRA